LIAKKTFLNFDFYSLMILLKLGQGKVHKFAFVHDGHGQHCERVHPIASAKSSLTLSGWPSWHYRGVTSDVYLKMETAACIDF